MSKFYKTRKEKLAKEKNKNPWDDFPKYKHRKPWTYMRVRPWSKVQLLPMDEFDLGWRSPANATHPLEHVLPQPDHPPEFNTNDWKLHTDARKPYWTTTQMGFDDASRLNLNKKKIGPQWKYYDTEVIYRINKQGFRNDVDFEDVDWKNSYVITGCSHVLGIGQHVDDTFASILSNKINAPVINLGVGGTGNDTIMHNFVHLVRKYGKPKGVFVLWTYPYRFAKNLAYQTEGYDAHGQYSDSVWNRFDVLPGQDTPDNYRDNLGPDEMYNHLTIEPAQFIDNPEMYYRRTLAQETLIAIMGEENVFEQRADFPGWMWRGDIAETSPYTLRDLVPDDMVEIVTNVLENRKEPKLKHWEMWNNPDGTLSREQLFVLNKIKARDLSTYSEDMGPVGGHWGPVINKVYINTWMKQYAKRD